MDKFIIEGGGKLYGRTEIQAAKNSVLPLLAASVLTDEQVTIRDVPAISDVENMLHILSRTRLRNQPYGRQCNHRQRERSFPRNPREAYKGTAFFRFYAGFGAHPLPPRENFLSRRLRYRASSHRPASCGVKAAGRKDRGG